MAWCRTSDRPLSEWWLVYWCMYATPMLDDLKYDTQWAVSNIALDGFITDCSHSVHRHSWAFQITKRLSAKTCYWKTISKMTNLILHGTVAVKFALIWRNSNSLFRFTFCVIQKLFETKILASNQALHNWYEYGNRTKYISIQWEHNAELCNILMNISWNFWHILEMQMLLVTIKLLIAFCHPVMATTLLSASHLIPLVLVFLAFLPLMWKKLIISRKIWIQLEQVERLRSEDAYRRLMIAHTIESYWILSQKKTKSKLQI